MTNRSTRSNRIVHIVTLIALLTTALLSTAIAPATTLAGGSCGPANGDNAKIFVGRHMQDTTHPTTSFDKISATFTVAELDPCTSDPIENGKGSYILPANLEDLDATDQLMQIGYGQRSDDDYYHWWYTPAGNGVAVLWPGSSTPVLGGRYKLEIYKYQYDDSPVRYKARFRITNVATGGVNWALSTVDWQGYDFVWWGAETLDSGSRLGAQAGTTYDDVHMEDLTYSQNYYGDIIRSGIVDAWWGETGCAEGSNQFEARNCKWRTGSVSGNEIGDVYTNVYTNDSLEIQDNGQ